MPSSVALLLGKPPRDGTIAAETIERLEGAGVRCRTLLPHTTPVDAASIADVDLVLHRGLGAEHRGLLRSLAERQVPLCNPWAGVSALADRATLHSALVESTIPTAAATVESAWQDVLLVAAGRDVVVKPAAGPGRGESLHTTPLPQEPSRPGPYLVEERIVHDGIDRKLYLAGDWVAGLLKPSPLTAGHTTTGEAFDVPRELADLGRHVLEDLGLHLAGVDVVIGPDGPVVVDVNAFPGYRGLPGAAAAVVTHVLTHLADHAT